MYGLNEIYSFCDFFQWDDCKTLTIEWIHLIESIIKHSKYCEFHKSNALSFWSEFLKTDHVAWTDKTRLLIHTILVLPIGSAEAERGFSIMNHILTSRRMSLTSEHVDDLLRVRINGPDDLREFSAEKYASIWVRGHKRSDDPSCKKSKKRQGIATGEDQAQQIFLPQSTIF